MRTGMHMAPSPMGAPHCPPEEAAGWQVCQVPECPLSQQSWHPEPRCGGSTTPPDPTHSPNPTAPPGLHPALISACCLAVPWRLRGQRSPLHPSLYTPVIFNSAYANPESGMSSGRGPRGNGHGANFLPFLPLFLYNIQQRFSSLLNFHWYRKAESTEPSMEPQGPAP